MLPFLDNKKLVGSVIAQRKGKLGVEVAPEVESGEKINPALKAAAEDMLRAIEHKSVIDLAKAIEAAVDACSGKGESEEEQGEQE